MNDHIHRIIAGALLLGGCSVSDDQFNDLAPETLEAPASVGNIGTTSQAEPYSLSGGLDSRCVDLGAPIIGIVQDVPSVGDVDCNFSTLPDGWKATPLFTEGSPWLAQASISLPHASPLRKFCRYDYAGGGLSNDQAYDKFVNAAGRARSEIDPSTIATDCPSVVPNGLFSSSVIDGLHDAYMANVGAVTADDLSDIEFSPTLLTFLDTAHEGYTPSYEHADLLRNLAFDLSCPDSREDCSSQLQRVLVTPRSTDDDYKKANWYNGGDVGYMHELGMGLVEAVLTWRALNDDGDPNTHTPMVINMSVAADLVNAYATNTGYAPTLAVLEASKMAYCYGNILVGAAGNGYDQCTIDGGGLLLPALFEEVTPPTQTECAAMGYIPDWSTTLHPVYSPLGEGRLVYAVGGRDEQDRFIANQRPNSGTKHQAPASGALSSVDSTPMTGTSIAAAAYSAAAHLVWSANPGLRPDEVIGLLYDSGYSLGEPAVVGGFVGTDMRRLSICSALAASDAGQQLNCAATAPDPNGNLDGFVAATLTAIADASEAGTLWTADPQQSPLAQLCLDNQPTPFVLPQPKKPICAVCSVDVPPNVIPNDDTLYMSIAQMDWAVDLTVDHAYLHVTDSGSQTSTVTLDASVVAEINAATSTDVIEVPLDVPGTVSAVLEFEYDDSSTYDNPITVTR